MYCLPSKLLPRSTRLLWSFDKSFDSGISTFLSKEFPFEPCCSIPDSFSYRCPRLPAPTHWPVSLLVMWLLALIWFWCNDCHRLSLAQVSGRAMSSRHNIQRSLSLHSLLSPLQASGVPLIIQRERKAENKRIYLLLWPLVVPNDIFTFDPTSTSELLKAV